jgi:hypothetical protein
MCTRASLYRRARRCNFGGRCVTTCYTTRVIMIYIRILNYVNKMNKKFVNYYIYVM